MGAEGAGMRPAPRGERKRQVRAVRCRYRERIYDQGEYREVKIYPVFSDAPRGSRRRKFRPTGEAQRRLNEYNSSRRLARLIEANFTARDVWITLTFRPDALPGDDRELLRIFRNFARRLKRAYAKRGTELKYVAAAERSDTGRYHLHLIANGLLTPDEIRDLWGLGRVRCEALEFGDAGLQGLAEYMTKYRQITRRYLCSRNLKQPEATTRETRYSQREIRELREAADDPAAWAALYPGYRLIRGCPFYNDVTGRWYFTAFLRADKKGPPVRRSCG